MSVVFGSRMRGAPGAVVTAATFVTIGLARWPLIWTLLVLAPASIALSRRTIARRDSGRPCSGFDRAFGASAWIMALAADTSWIAVGITAAAAAIGCCNRLNPLWVFAIAAIMGGIGSI